MRRTAALIVGGGPAGAAAAIALADARPVLLERSRETGDALCGGFLSWRTLETLTALGIAPDLLNPADVRRLRLFAAKAAAEVPLPRPAKAVSRHRLDTLLLARAAEAGARVERGAAVREIDGGEVRLADGATLAADALFLASGKHDVRGLARPAAARGRDPTLGLRVRLAPAPALAALVADAIELHLFDRGYAGCVMQEDGTANLCLAVRRSRFVEAGGPDALLSAIAAEVPALADRLAYRGGGAIDAVANVPYGWRTTATAPGTFRLGDQAGVIPSLAGEGMGIALASGTRAAAAWAVGGPAAATRFQASFARALGRPVGLAGLAWHLAERPALARLAPMLARAAPPLVDWLARATRIGGHL